MYSPVATVPGPVVDAASVTFRLPAVAGVTAVRLWQEVRIPGDRLNFVLEDSCWALTVDRPAVDRMEYLFEVRYHDGRQDSMLDPGNPLRVGGAFGDKSVVEFPEYESPAWLDRSVPAGRFRDVAIPARSLAATVHCRLWTPEGVPDNAIVPLLVAHDGPEYDALSSLTHYLGVQVADGTLAPLRAALLSPGHRNEWYSASSAYSRALRLAVLPALDRVAPTNARIGMGASLGGLAVLHAQRRFADSFDGLFLQSASFFHPRYDAHERRFGRYARITRFVGDVLAAESTAWEVPVVLTCGAIEENLENNRLVSRALSAQGHPTSLHELSDMHNYTAWRDAFHPHLGELIKAATP